MVPKRPWLLGPWLVFLPMGGARKVVEVALGLLALGLGLRVGIVAGHVVSWSGGHVGHIVHARVSNSHWGRP